MEGRRVGIDRTIDALKTAIEKVAAGETIAGLDLTILLAGAACADFGATAVMLGAVKGGAAVAGALKAPGLESNHALLDMTRQAKWEALAIIARETARGGGDDENFTNNSALKKAYDAAVALAKENPGAAADARDAARAKPRGFIDRLLKKAGKPAEDDARADFTEADQNLLRAFDAFFAREAGNRPDGAAGAALYQAIASAAVEEALGDLFALPAMVNTRQALTAFETRCRDPKVGFAPTFRALLKARLDDPRNDGAAKRILVAFTAETLQCAAATSKLVEGLGDRIGAIGAALTQHEGYLKEILARLSPELPLDPTGSASRSVNAEFNQLTFVSRRTEFLGREGELAALRQFLNDDRKVLWHQIAGDAGQGKSRLALELVREIAEDWHAGFLMSGDFPAPDRWNTLTVARPTLCVIDYIAAPQKAEAAADALIALDRRAAALPAKMRFLFIERAPFNFDDRPEATALWFSAFKQKGKAGALRGAAFDPRGPVLLDTLKDDELTGIAQSWRTAQEKAALTDDQTKTLIAMLSPAAPDGGVRARAPAAIRDDLRRPCRRWRQGRRAEPCGGAEGDAEG
ncbi:MAG TPA: hypothetical protein DEA40_02355 [Parvularcula sp.]|nr:hypothetical protein [Parvularcula sp.]